MQIKNGWQKLIELIQNAQGSARQLENLLDFLFTDEEKSQMAKRVILTNYLLYSEKTQRKIAAELEVSLTTITRCSNLLKHTKNEIKKQFDFAQDQSTAK